ncbi:two component transcriptional regulator, winged helix family [Sulfuricella denitrificans skB26]|uniref:Two component transcriptional regulator, winged helix family n=1 Tax=Sulfuricella denitrificans (strain DSM 22764 / NBRC 105220 / skB26) TaxID=1163617 RepID=S6AI46_SULDS|nr:response regulator [Sulfuricella denitrificans]BAN35866.1 two component transcriptional regulator, winged helix family [Sulfuricella denitrificans skB26]
MRILLVEDDAVLAHALKQALVQGGAVVDCAVDGEEASRVLEDQTFDVVLLDIGLPKLDGFSVLSQVRARDTSTPILIMTARDSLMDRVRGLDLGADDYLVKPFDLPELEARVRALFRRRHGTSGATLSHGMLEVNLFTRQAFIDGKLFELTLREFGTLEVLLLKVGQVISKEDFTRHLYSWGDEVTENAIEVCMHRLRKKLTPYGIEIRTVRGLGYMLERPDLGS